VPNTLVNLARVQSTTQGQGTLTLGSAIAGFNTFADAGLTDGQTVTYAIEDYSSDTPAAVTGREIGQGVYSAGTLTRGTVYSSTSGGAKINCTGTQQVFITAAAEDLASFTTDLTAHLNDTSGAHAASAISFTPAGNVAATDVQAAIAELDTEKLSTSAAASTYQPLDADLTAIAALSGTNNIYYRSAANTWSSVTVSANLGFSAGTLGSSLGTAATYNVGTSGATVPLLGASNTWAAGTVQTFGSGTATGAAVDIFLDTSLGAPLALVSSDASASRGPNLLFRRTSPSPAVSDDGGAFLWQMNDDAANILSVATVGIRASSVTSGAFSGTLRFQTMQAGSLALRAQLGAGLVVGSPTGSDTGAGTINAVTLYENGTSLASKYQGLDSELTAIAGLTSAADRLPYFTGSGTAALATFTTAGRNLVDDADTTAQRTTLGLGTAATQNTGTSGANLPFLNGTNTWSAGQTIDQASLTVNLDTAFGAPLVVVSNDAGANRGPNFLFRRQSASPATNDDAGAFLFQANDNAATPVLQTYATIGLRCTAVTSGAFSGRIRFQTAVAAAFGERGYFGHGFVVGGPTGGDKGAGTINAVGVYDDSVLLCAPVEFMKSGTVNTATWDDYTVEVTEGESSLELQEEVEISLDEPEYQIVAQRDGTYKKVEVTTKRVPALDEKPVVNDKGEVVDTIKVPRITKTTTPGRTIKRQNELAHEFKAMLDEGFDPRDPKAYFDKMLADEALPGLKTKANWVPNEESNAKRTNRIILALELQTAAFKTVYEQVEALKAEVESLKKARR
jgi:hypothetical protein